jgi:leucyl/phenylalanyl-tRNA--protein transferase
MRRLRITRLDADPGSPFPPCEHALRDPDGLLAFGGDLHPERLLNAYRNGIFPWPVEGQPLLWWAPDPRMVRATGASPLNRRMRRSLRSCGWQLTADTAFRAVITACATSTRREQPSTWISTPMIDAYCDLHRMGHAHSVEVWDAERLVGGIYGIQCGRMFFGESLFGAESGASKVALAALCRHLHRGGVPLLDAQVDSAHLRSLGFCTIPRSDFMRELADLVDCEAYSAVWPAGFGPALVVDLLTSDASDDTPS